MPRQSILLAAFLVALILSIIAMAPPTQATQGAAAAQKPGCTGNINLTTTVYDFDSSGAPLSMRSDDYNGIGQATYTTINGCGNTADLFSGINSAGIWHLDLYHQSIRTLWITPNDAINGSQPAGPPAGYYWQAVEAYSQCYDQNGNIVPFENLTNGSDNCSLGVDFQPGSIKYKLVMSPHLPATGPATGLASVACNAVSNNQCVNWTITPNTGAANPTVADLFYYGKRGLVFVGQYYNMFRINSSNP
jgi:hypothetical protein